MQIASSQVISSVALTYHTQPKRAKFWWMPPWERRTKVLCAGVATAAYFLVAGLSILTYVDRAPKGRLVLQIFKPFERLENAFIGRGPAAVRLEALADSEDNNERSPVVIYEDQTPLGPAHSSHADIMNFGRGRFSHWRGQGFVLSASDNGDPNTNGRNYFAVLPY